MPTTTSTKSSIIGLQGVMSFSCNFRPSNDARKTATGILDTAELWGQNGGKTKHVAVVREKRSSLMVIGRPTMEDFYGESDSGSARSKLSSEFESALAILPPSDKWDRLQRARHYARDPVFREWPPAIRLFHPFDKSPDIAFEIAQLVEDYDIEPFEIRLDTWVIIPNMEETVREWDNQDVLPDVEEGDGLESYYEKLEREADKEVKELIRNEEIIGKMKKQQKKYTSRKGTSNKKPDEDDGKKTRTREKKSPAQIREEQRKIIEEDFGGPCILCLEPDEESKEKIMELREVLREGLDFSSYSSPSSVYAWDYIEQMDMGYRPLIPISKFDSLKNAMEVAGKLKGFWGAPLTFDVESVDILSCKDPADDNDDLEDFDDIMSEYNSFKISNKEQLFAQQASQYEMNKNTWGCNARIMLVGEEIEQDDTANEEMIEKLLESGEIGGGDISMDFTILDDEEESISDIEKWLDDDDEFDEGTQVVIGRAHFYTGDQRNYVGMPVTSSTDAKDRYLGESGSVSGLARRRGSVSRSSGIWEDGEFGRRTKDHLPWQRDRARRAKNETSTETNTETIRKRSNV
eukprot:CAMPEP_0116147406 /NCGR_PEP_ID=MMETSP0329-20121206/17737_1 /TAXON_ID=697910 /ORGANISM="Pseudo-nitzschia arenysensis, Strain B593" /LENGTH=575 /DNA_ID=CAMNT_0003643331 /DNA_START=308 /DNA_END=2033 /DNA_ORIENTATION=-